MAVDTEPTVAPETLKSLIQAEVRSATAKQNRIIKDLKRQLLAKNRRGAQPSAS